MEQVNVELVNIFQSIAPDKMNVSPELNIPNEIYQVVLDCFLERGYLNMLSQRESFVDYLNVGAGVRRSIGWMRILRLPVHPSMMKEYDLFSRWQGVLATLHSWGHRMTFLLQRSGGETCLYLGVAPMTQGVTKEQALDQFYQATVSNMPGIDLQLINSRAKQERITSIMLNYQMMGAITGIPSLRKNNQDGFLQTLDQLAFGIRDVNGNERDFSLLIVADPIDDMTISNTISNFRRLGSEIHLDVLRSSTDSQSRTDIKGSQVGLSAIMATLGNMLPIAGLGAILGGVGALMNKSYSKSVTKSNNLTTQYLDKFADYAEKTLDQHCLRLNKGRNLGFWNTGVYVLGQTGDDINTVMGMLRSVYSGDESFIEPIRTHLLRRDSGCLDIIRRCDLIPLELNKQEVENNDRLVAKPPHTSDKEPWSILGEIFQYVSTPLNTEELSITTALPRRDVPGLRFVKSAVRFASNSTACGKDCITLGHLVDTGVRQASTYSIDVSALVRHMLVTGSTGSGKSTTCKTIITQILQRQIPTLIIEPAKDEYVRWAIEWNKALDADETLTEAQREQQRFQIYMPGVDELDGMEIERLKLNPFQPAAVAEAPIDVMTRCEQVISLFNASLPVSDVLPILLDESMYRYALEKFGQAALDGDIAQRSDYPRLDGVIATAQQVLAARGYDKKVQDDIRAALHTRFSYLTRGKRGSILNVNCSTSYDKLFNRPTVINLSRISGSKDKALIMSILLLSLYEYRISAFQYDAAYRENARKNKLLHLTVVEEAHNVLTKPSADFSGTGNAQQAVADFFTNMLSEIRSYGQGMMIVDQVPTRLIPDAIKNTNYKIVHRLVAPDDCAVMAAGLALRPDQTTIIPSLEIGNAILCGDMDDAATWVQITPSLATPQKA